jgi:hypothetical protein
MGAGSRIPVHFVFILWTSLVPGTGTALAEACFPHCDYTHYYGPLDFSYRQPGLFGYPPCGPQGNCTPHLAYTTGILQKRLAVRFPRVNPVPPLQP